MSTNAVAATKRLEIVISDDRTQAWLYRARTADPPTEAEILAEGGNYLLPEWWKYDTREPADGFFVMAVDLAGFTPMFSIFDDTMDAVGHF